MHAGAIPDVFSGICEFVCLCSKEKPFDLSSQRYTIAGRRHALTLMSEVKVTRLSNEPGRGSKGRIVLRFMIHLNCMDWSHWTGVDRVEWTWSGYIARSE